MTPTEWAARVDECVQDWSHFFWADVPVLCIDTETTGFSREDRICEIALVLSQGGKVIREYHSLVNPGFPIPSDATAIHGVDDYDVVDSPSFDDILDDVLDFLTEDAPWIAHGMNFDARMLSYDIPASCWPSGIPTLCTLDYAKHRNAVTKMRGKHKLTDLANYFDVGYEPEELHSALYDARLLSSIVPYLMGGRQVAYTMTRLSQDWLK